MIDFLWKLVLWILGGSKASPRNRHERRRLKHTMGRPGE